MSEDAGVSIVDRTTTSFGLEIVRIRGESDDQAIALEGFGLSRDMRGRLALERAREIQARSRLVSSISNPTLLRLYGVRRIDGKHYVEREDVQGGVYLCDYLKGKTAPPAAVIGWVSCLVQLCKEYEKLDLDIRGLSDRNILITRDGDIRVIDPGVARALVEFRGDSEDPDNFLAPEYVTTETWTPASNMFVLGILMYEMLTGTKPFDDPKPENVVENIVRRKQMDPRYLNPAVSQQVSAVVGRLLEKSPERRYASMDELAAELQTIMDQKTFESGPAEREAFEKQQRKVEASNKAWQRRRWFNRNRAAVLIAAAIVLAVVLLIVTNPETPPVITADMTAQDVVELYYQALADSDPTALEQILAKSVDGRNGIITRASTIHVVVKMQDVQRFSVPVAGGNAASETRRPFVLEDIQITPIEQGDATARFVTTYAQKFIDQGDLVTQLMRETAELTKTESLWRITSLESVQLSEERTPQETGAAGNL